IALAAASRDQVEVALLQGRIEGQVFQLSYLAAMSALNAHDLEVTRSWLLVRLFTQSTRLARPSADSTLALESVQAGTLDVSAAAGIVSADLLDTYQSEIQRHLDDLQAGNAQSKLRTAQSIGLVQGLWPLLSDAFAEQLGEPARAELSRTINQLSMASVTGDSSQIGTVDIALGNFRAAPLSAEEQSGRARQLILYMGLVPKEYSRGVRAGQVVSTIEILEASTFLTGARAAFADLRPSLNQVNPETTQQLSGQLMALSALIDGSMAGTAIAEPETVHDAVSAIETTFRELVPGEWLQAGGDADFDVVISLLEQMETAAAAGQFKQAESARLEAYAVFDAGAEKRLLAFAPGLAQSIETGFWSGTSKQPGLASLLANKAPIGEITVARQALVRDLTAARQQLGAGSTASGAVIFNAGSIVFREGLEAVLILASLLASMTGDNKRLKRPLALGSSLALAASVVLFVLARSIGERGRRKR
ncbi:MAG TPA: hypothetical protein PK691_12305, partial [Thermomicrobiales bacterium]|nr:hypothetical protein [Thermomicrobiales bacterium]